MGALGQGCSPEGGSPALNGRILIRVLVRTAAFLAAVAVLVGFVLPPARLSPAASFDDGSVPGAVHIHTNRSDGRGTPEEVAAIAARAGLRFVVFTDHGDGMRTPDLPVYRSGVLCLDGVEISTTKGHMLALGLAESPFPLGGEPRDVLDDVHRLGGFGVAAHPDSPKAELQWGDWTTPVDGLEIVNLDTSWRVVLAEPGWGSRRRLLVNLLAYPFRPSETISRLIADRPALLARWRAMTTDRAVPLIAGGDAHARLELGDREPRTTRVSLPVPGYEAVFRTLSLRLRPSRELSGDPIEDARLVLEAMRLGHGYLAIDAVMEQPSFIFSAANGAGAALAGDTLPVGGATTFSLKTNAPPSFVTTVWRDAERVSADSSKPELTLVEPEREAVYRVEVRSADERPWIISNPIYLRGRSRAPALDARPVGRRRRSLFDGKDTGGWRTESAAQSVVAFDATTSSGERALRMRWGLPRGMGPDQYAALVTDVAGGLKGFDRLAFSARADRPMRLSVQLRTPGSQEAGERWRRSVFIDTATSMPVVFFKEFVPVEPAAPDFDPVRVESVLFTVDTTNASPGSSGIIWLSDVTLQGP